MRLPAGQYSIQQYSQIDKFNCLLWSMWEDTIIFRFCKNVSRVNILPLAICRIVHALEDFIT